MRKSINDVTVNNHFHILLSHMARFVNGKSTSVHQVKHKMVPA